MAGYGFNHTHTLAQPCDRRTDRHTELRQMLARLKKKNRNSQKSVKSVRLMDVGVYSKKDFLEKICFQSRMSE